MFAARITLHHAHLSHSLSRSRTTADNLYGCEDSRLWTPPNRQTSKSPLKKRSKSTRRLGGIVEGNHDDEPYPEDTWVYASARAGEMWLRIGLIRQRARNRDNEDSARLAQGEIEALTAEGEAIARQCEGLGGTLRAIGEVLRACLSNEVLKSKGHLRTALDVASSSQDNHLRALIIALISSHYFHTARNHAENMLLTCEQLAAGMGAQSRLSTNDNNSKKRSPLTTSDKVNLSQKGPNKDSFSTTKPRSKRKASEIEPDENSTPSPRPLKEKSDAGDSCSQVAEAIGNAQLRLWIGERFLELSKWEGNEEKVKMHDVTIQKFQEAVRSIEQQAGLINVG